MDLTEPLSRSPVLLLLLLLPLPLLLRQRRLHQSHYRAVYEHIDLTHCASTAWTHVFPKTRAVPFLQRTRCGRGCPRARRLGTPKRIQRVGTVERIRRVGNVEGIHRVGVGTV